MYHGPDNHSAFNIMFCARGYSGSLMAYGIQRLAKRNGKQPIVALSHGFSVPNIMILLPHQRGKCGCKVCAYVGSSCVCSLCVRCRLDHGQFRNQRNRSRVPTDMQAYDTCSRARRRHTGVPSQRRPLITHHLVKIKLHRAQSTNAYNVCKAEIATGEICRQP